MRKVFTSARIENVERVAELLRESAIEARVTGGRGWKGAIRGNFSYREQARQGPQPEVWVIRSDEYPRARQVLRDNGLLQAGPGAESSYVGASMHGDRTQAAAAGKRPGSRARTGALVAVAAAVVLGYFTLRWSASRAPRASMPVAAVPAAGSDLIADGSAVHRIDTPPALAAVVVATELEQAQSQPACIAIDGKDPPAQMLAGLQGRWQAAQPASACADGRAALRLDVTDYRTDGSGTGTVRLDVVRVGEGASRTQARIYGVRRTGTAWRVLRTVSGSSD